MANYDGLARLMDNHPELLILRSFSCLNVKSLLYWQAELAHLEVELQEVELEDRACGRSPRTSFGASWKTLSTGYDDASPLTAEMHGRDAREGLQWQIVCRIRSVLRDYNAALLQHSQVKGILTKVGTEDLRDLVKWLQKPDYGNNFLKSQIESVWDARPGHDDLCSLVERNSKKTILTSYLGRLILHLRRDWTGSRDPAGHIYALDERTQEWIASGVMTVASSVFPVLPIVILFFINRLLVRLGLILVFTAIFAGVLVFGMRLEPDKTLAITTAFAAIQVVFVGSTSNGPAS